MGAALGMRIEAKLIPNQFKGKLFLPCCFFDPMTDILWDSRGTSKDPMLGSSGFPCLILFFSFNFVLLVVFFVCLFFG